MNIHSLIKSARLRLLQMHFESGVGHIGGNLSCIDVLMVLHHQVLEDADSFILSKGHAAGALYVTLASTGRISDEMLTTFHQDNTKLPGHPIGNAIPGIPFSTGSLGHGIGLAAGVALAKKLKNEPGHVYCLTSDGEWQEGSTWEALFFIAHHRLANLTLMVDANGLQGFGSTQEVLSLSVLADKVRPFGVDVREVSGHDYLALDEILQEKTEQTRVIFLKTTKGKGVSFMEDKMEWHYLPLSKEQYAHARREIEAT